MNDKPLELCLGVVPADEDCAQLGTTENFSGIARLEIQVYRAALIAVYGAPPEGAELICKPCPHDFGTYYELVIRYRPAKETVEYASAVDASLAFWLEAGFIAPVSYDQQGKVCEIVEAAVASTIVRLKRLQVLGHASPQDLQAIEHLVAAFPAPTFQAQETLRGLGQPFTNIGL